MGVGSPIPFEDSEAFSYMPNIVGVATPMLFWNSYEKSMSMGASTTYGEGVYCKKTRSTRCEFQDDIQGRLKMGTFDNCGF